MATYSISVLSTSGTGNGYRFSGNDKNGSISSSTSNPTININAGDTINFTFSNSTSHPFTVGGTTISGESATGGYYSTPTSESYTFSSAMTYTYVCNVHSSMTGSIIASSSSGTTTTTTTAAPTTTTTTTTTATTAGPTTTTTTTTTASPATTTTTTTTTTTAAPDGTATTTTTASPSLTTTTTTTTLAPSISDSGWTITRRRSDTFKDASTFFTFDAPTGSENLSIVDVELQTQKVDQAVSASTGWIEKTATTKTGSVPAINDPNRRRINNIDTTNLSVGMLVTGNNIPGNTVISNIDNNSSTITVSNAVEGESSDLEGTLDFVEYIPPKRVKMIDLPYIDYTRLSDLPATCQPASFSARFNNPKDAGITYEGNTIFSAYCGRYFSARWSVNVRQRVTRLKENEDGSDLIDVPTTVDHGYQLWISDTPCVEDAPNNASSGPNQIDIPPPEFVGGEQNASSSSASMTMIPFHADREKLLASTLTVTAGDSEITGSVTFEGEFFTMLWNVPEEKKIEIEYPSNSVVDKATYDLYGYSFEVKDPSKAGWRQFAEYTDDNSAPSGCYDPHWKGFDAQWGDDSDRGEDQTVIRGNQGREYMAGEPLNANYKSDKEVTDWVEYNYPEKYIPVGYNLPPGTVLPIPASDLVGPGFLRSYEYEFRVRAIYKVTKVTQTGYEFSYNMYTNPEVDGNTGGLGNFAVATNIVCMGRVSRARNANFGSGGTTIFNSEQEDPNNPFAPPEE